jgi:hypothetical protein
VAGRCMASVGDTWRVVTGIIPRGVGAVTIDC